MRALLITAAVFVAAWAAPAHAQGQVQVRGFGDLGVTTFSAAESFSAVLGSNRGLVFGGGVEVAHPSGVFGSVRVSRFSSSGERVFLFEGERFSLGVPTTVRVVPIVFSAGYRLDRWPRVSPYGAGGIGLHRYTETSDVAAEGENVDEAFTGYHLTGGVEFRLSPRLAAAGEVDWSTVPDALGGDPNGVAAAFDEHDLGGLTVRVKVGITLTRGR